MTDLGPAVHIVDDDDGVRSSIRMLMKSIGLSAACFASASDFLVDYQPARGGCVILDIRMPGMSGLELQQELTRRGAIIPVIFITGHGDVPMAVEAMHHGAFDFLQKPFRDQELIDRVQQAMQLDQQARDGLREHSRIRSHLTSLTPRERQVLDLLTAGKANKTMAHELHLSQRTVEIHRARVMEKMAARSIAQLVRMMLDVGEGPATTAPARVHSP